MSDAKQPDKLRVGILFGGKSAEHEISIQSAKNVIQALDRDAYEPVLIGIDTSGQWHLQTDENAREPASSDLAVTLTPGGDGQLLATGDGRQLEKLDIVFPVLHGPQGEDGAVQGLLELANVPYVGSGVLGSAIGMDKDVQKRLLRDAGIKVADFLTITSAEKPDTGAIIKRFGLPLFVKPANMGSSVGVTRVDTDDQLQPAITDAFHFDTKVLLEEAISGDEIECAVLGNGQPRASGIGRIIPQGGDFYSYESKYVNEDGAALEIPAKLSEEVAAKAREIALETFKVLGCEGMARVDMFTSEDGSIAVNEVNTIPGFTQISMYPKLWELSGVSYQDLITELIKLALQRFEQRQKLQTTYQNHV